MAFLGIYSYVLLVKLTADRWHSFESLLAIWITTIGFEEIRQFTVHVYQNMY
jgi:hypothetical protein